MAGIDEWLQNFEYNNALNKCIIFVHRTLLAQKLSLSSNKRMIQINLLQWILLIIGNKNFLINPKKHRANYETRI